MSQSNLNTDSGKAAIENNKLSVEDAISFFATEDDDNTEVIELDDKKTAAKSKSDDNEVKDKKEAKSDSEPDDTDDDNDEGQEKSLEDEIEEELNEETEEPEEELELIAPVRRKEILAKYPNLFKDFPYLQKAYYLEQKYSEILPTLDDAKAAVEKSSLLDKYESEIMDGSTESILSAVRDGDKEAFAKVVDNYLPNLRKVDENAFFHVAGNVIKDAIIAMVQGGKEENNDELIQAAEIIHKYIFGTSKFTPPTRMSKDNVTNNETKQREEQISEREKKFLEQQFETANGSLSTRIDNVIKSTVDKNIDPNNSMTDYVRRTASREVVESLENMISKDTRFMSVYDRLWEKAVSDNFSSESMDRIKSAYLSKAKTLLPDLIKKSRSEALKGVKRANNSNDENTVSKKGPLPVGKTRSSASSPNGGKSQVAGKSSIPRGMSSLEYLMQD